MFLVSIAAIYFSMSLFVGDFFLSLLCFIHAGVVPQLLEAVGGGGFKGTSKGKFNLSAGQLERLQTVI